MTAVLTIVLLGMVGTVLSLMDVQSKRTAADLEAELAEGTLDAAIGAALTRAMVDEVPPASLTGTVPSGLLAGRLAWAATVRRSAEDGTLWKVSAATTVRDGSGATRVYRTAQVIIERPESAPGLPPVPPGILGAVTSHHPIAMHANLQINGNNHLFTGTRVTDPEDPLYAQSTYGLTTKAGTGTSTINASNISGNNGATGFAAVNANAATVPNTPARALSAISGANVITDAQLQARSHMIHSATELTSFLNDPANLQPNGKLKNDKPIYITFDFGNNSYWSSLNAKLDPDKAYILIHHRPRNGVEAVSPNDEPQGVADPKNVHIDMKGILIFDKPHHVNGGTTVVGAVISMAHSSVLRASSGTYIHDKFGQGGATIMYSTPAIGLALRDGLGFQGEPGEDGGEARVLSLIRAPAIDAELLDALELCGMTTTGMAVPGGGSAWVAPGGDED